MKKKHKNSIITFLNPYSKAYLPSTSITAFHLLDRRSIQRARSHENNN